MKKVFFLLTLGLISFTMIACEITTTPTTSTTSSSLSSSSTSTTESTTVTTSQTTTQTTTQTTMDSTTESTTASTTTLPRYQTIELYSMNDLHGTAYSSFATFSKVANFLSDKNDNYNNNVMIATGDMLQGTALSNYYHGRPIIEILDSIGFDAFVLGNHEFDWGIDEIAQYSDGLPENGEASFPFLSANIVTIDGGFLLPWTLPYTIIDVEGVQVGVLGVIGEVINSISASRVAGYEFADPMSVIEDTVYEMRTIAGCDVVVVAIHDYSLSLNQEISALRGDYRVDAMFNGHTHSSVNDALARTGTSMPYAQVSNSSSSLFAQITLIYDRETHTVTAQSSQIYGEYHLTTRDSEADAIITQYSTDQDYVDFVTELLAQTARSYSKSELAPWGASVIKEELGIDFGMLNSGGFRVSMPYGNVLMEHLVTIYPFDNYIKTCEMTGAQIRAFYLDAQNRGYDVVFDSDVELIGNDLYSNGVLVNLSQIYTVGAVDYIFDKTNYAFLSGANIQTTSYLMRDLLAADLRQESGLFNPNDGPNTPLSTRILPTYYLPSDLRHYLDEIAVKIA